MEFLKFLQPIINDMTHRKFKNNRSSISFNNLLCEFYDHDGSSVYDRALIKTHAC